MAEIKRMSMNTLISNSRLFYETSSDDSDSEGSQKENSESNDNNKSVLPTLLEKERDVKVKCETTKSTQTNWSESTEFSSTESDILQHIKTEPAEDAPIKVKLEPTTPIKLEVPCLDLDESLDLDSMEMLALKTPIKTEETSKQSPSSHSKSNLKSIARSLSKHRSSPYSKDRGGIDESRLPPKLRKLNEYSGMTTRERRPRETDPAILERRQKQIDFGKNTIGYDNYMQMVSRLSRTNEHPTTPNKYKKYSRRAWDGLIKQWRIKLHSYDDYKEGDVEKNTVT